MATTAPATTDATATTEKQLIEYRVEEGLAIMELNDPPANTYTYEMMRQKGSPLTSRSVWPSSRAPE